MTQTILLWDKMSRSPGFGEAPQQAFLRPPRAAKIASVATLALLAVSALPLENAKIGVHFLLCTKFLQELIDKTVYLQ